MVRQSSSSYLEEAEQVRPLPADEEQALAKRFRDDGDQLAGHRLVRAHIRFVYKVAHSFRGYGLPFEDLVQEGNVGLLEAVRRFEPERGHRLISYAVHWIRAQMQAYVVQQYSLVRVGTSQVQRKLFYRLRRERGEMTEASASGEPPSDEQLAERLQVSKRSVTEMRKRLSGQDVSLDAKVFDDSERTWASAVPAGDATPEERTADAELSAELRARLPGLVADELDDRERYILERRIFMEEPWTLEHIGSTLGITRERTRQLEARAKAKLRVGLADLVA